MLGLFYDGGAGFCSMMAGLGMCKSVSVKRAVQKTAVVGWKKIPTQALVGNLITK